MSAPSPTLRAPAERLPAAPPWGRGLGLRRDVFLVPLPDGTGWLLDLHGSFFALNTTALGLLRAALAMGDEGPARLAELWGAPVDRVRADQTEMIEQLVRRGLLATGEPEAARPSPRWPSLLLRMAVGAPTIPRVSRLLMVAWVLFRRIGWQRTIEIARRWSQRPPSASMPEGFDEELVQTLRDATAACPLWVGCKERSLAAAAVQWAAGRPAKVVLGVSPYPLASHAWCEVEGRVLTDPPDRIAPFLRVAEYA